MLGPLLFLVYINSLHKCLANSNVLLYADDAVIYTSHKEKRTLELMLTQDMNNIANWLDKNKLIINLKRHKTESMLLGTGQHLRKENVNPFSVKIRDQSICYSTSYKYLGITLDPMLTLSHHLLNTYRKVSGRLRLLKRIRPSLTILSARSIYQSMILPAFSYCNTITMDLYGSFMQKLRNFEDRANRIISNGLDNTHVDQEIPSILRVRDYNVCLLAFKCINSMTCDSFKSYLSLNYHEKTTKNNGKLIRVPKLGWRQQEKAFIFKVQASTINYPFTSETDSIIIFKNSI